MGTTKPHETIAASLFSLIPRLGSHHYHDLGINTDLSERLSRLSMHELQTIVSRAERYLTIHIDKPALERLLLDAASSKEDSELEDQFLYNYATSKMMNELFGMHTTEFVARRKILGLAGKGQHRPQYCDEYTEATIQDHWNKNSALEVRQRLLRVSELSGQPLNIVWPAIKRYQG